MGWAIMMWLGLFGAERWRRNSSDAIEAPESISWLRVAEKRTEIGIEGSRWDGNIKSARK